MFCKECGNEIKRTYPKPYILTPCSGWMPWKKTCRWGHLDGDKRLKINFVCFGSRGRHIGGKKNLIAACVEY